VLHLVSFRVGDRGDGTQDEERRNFLALLNRVKKCFLRIPVARVAVRNFLQAVPESRIIQKRDRKKNKGKEETLSIGKPCPITLSQEVH